MGVATAYFFYRTPSKFMTSKKRRRNKRMWYDRPNVNGERRGSAGYTLLVDPETPMPPSVGGNPTSNTVHYTNLPGPTDYGHWLRPIRGISAQTVQIDELSWVPTDGMSSMPLWPVETIPPRSPKLWQMIPKVVESDYTKLIMTRQALDVVGDGISLEGVLSLAQTNNRSRPEIGHLRAAPSGLRVQLLSTCSPGGKDVAEWERKATHERITVRWGVNRLRVERCFICTNCIIGLFHSPSVQQWPPPTSILSMLSRSDNVFGLRVRLY